MAEDVIPSIAERYHVSVEAAREVERALRAAGGRQAQFNHPDLGGYGQWMPGMVMVGRMGDDQLRARVAGLCDEVAAFVLGSNTSAPAALADHPSAPSAASRVDITAGGSWWPASLGNPSTSGSQNGARYAYFPDRRCLLIQNGGRIDCYDTGGRHISGASQQQGGSSSLTFSGPDGEVRLADLRCVPLESMA